MEQLAVQARGFGSPARYLQGPGLLDSLGKHVLPLGKSAYVLIDGFVADRLGTRLEQALRSAGVPFHLERFGGECSEPEISRATAAARQVLPELVIGVGGGKVLDTAKCVAVALGAAMVIVPTIASTDAPCSAIAVRYTTEGDLDTGLFLRRNPDLVLVDSRIIVDAPVRYLAAGIGDAYSTWIEARSNQEAGLLNFVGDRHRPTSAGLAIARSCHEILMEHAELAVQSARVGRLDPNVEAIIEANILLSGLGFENCGVSVAHGIGDALGTVDRAHRFLHGEKVAFGVLCLLSLEQRPEPEFAEAVAFLAAVGLPTRLGDFGLDDAAASAAQIARAAIGEGASTWRTAAMVSEASIAAAILDADHRAGVHRFGNEGGQAPG
jgi:glycerol dehydrogenase